MKFLKSILNYFTITRSLTENYRHRHSDYIRSIHSAFHKDYISNLLWRSPINPQFMAEQNDEPIKHFKYGDYYIAYELRDLLVLMHKLKIRPPLNDTQL